MAPKKPKLHTFSSVRIKLEAAKIIVSAALEEKRTDAQQAAYILEKWAVEKGSEK